MSTTNDTTTPAGSVQRPVLPVRTGAADAWLFILKRPGRITTFATVDETGSESWPWDEWTVVKRVALVEAGPAETLLDKRQNTKIQRP